VSLVRVAAQDWKTSDVNGAVKTFRGISYCPEHVLDIYRPYGDTLGLPVVLLWHGRGPDERHVLEPIADAAAARGLVVIVPDWRSSADDGGNEALRASLDFVGQRAHEFGGDPERVVLSGWSLGGTAGLGLVLSGECHPAGYVGIATGYDDVCPTTGRPLSLVLADQIPDTPIWLLHGTRDEVIPLKRGRAVAETLVDQGARIHWHEFDTDHAGIIMCRYDRSTRQCLPSDQDHAVAAGTGTAEILAIAAAGEGVR
jgi:acetyl esterase/lipase